MGAEVYANGDAISCKAGDGKVIAAMPDVCLSPPSPPAGPVPVPYPDTSFSKDMQNGTKTVQLKGDEAMMKDSSFFQTSPLGDEAATNGLGAGVITACITGKTYFVMWSMDVQFEGANVDRHSDLTTSNHASPMANGQPPQVQGETQASGGNKSNKCDHDWECEPIKPKEPQTKAHKVADLKAGKNAGDPFEAKCVEHNNSQIRTGDDVGCDFRCKKCKGVKEVDHVTRNADGKITKIVQCKADIAGPKGGKGVQVKPAQLAEDRKLVKAITECNGGSPEAKVEYKLQAGPSGDEAKKFLEKKLPPIITMVAG